VSQSNRLDLNRDESGFTLIELMVSVAVLMVISALMMKGTLDMSRLSFQQSNESEMQTGIRNATALLQQEVGQAGRMALPPGASLTSSVTAVGMHSPTVTPAALAPIFPGMRLMVGAGPSQEIVTVVAVSATQITANFSMTHASGEPIRPAGGFARGVIPTTDADGSTDSVLKIVGDVNSDGSLMYVEYTCDWTAGRLYRNMMAYDVTTKPALSVEQVLLDNLLPNPPDPDGTIPPCFTYEEVVVANTPYVINVAIMTTVRTHKRHPITGEFQTVTKALLNVAPRNVFHAWQIASLGYTDRIQPLPATVVALLD
jgi:prepilin-type N-terminal cleavage/methylation domain-containing protein